MRRSMVGLAVGAAVLLAGAAAAQESVECTVEKGGALVFAVGGETMARLELNAHGPEWKYSGQAEATATIEDEGVGKPKTITGQLAVANTPGGAVTFTQTVTPGENQVDVAYEISFTQVVSLNGLQVSLLLPAEQFAGKSYSIYSPTTRTMATVFPEKLDPAKWQIPSYKADTIRIMPDAEGGSATITLAEPVEIAVQDLRQWKREEFEIRMTLLAANEGQQVTAADSYQLKLSATLPVPVTVSVAP